MKWQLIVVGARTAVFGMLFLAGTAGAELRILNDPGGEVSSYLRTFYQMRASGERIIIDGPCLSACTLLTGIVPRDHVCITNRAVLGFHAASYYNDVSRSLVPSPASQIAVVEAAYEFMRTDPNPLARDRHKSSSGYSRTPLPAACQRDSQHIPSNPSPDLCNKASHGRLPTCRRQQHGNREGPIFPFANT
jgi:hypothetical protein